MFMKTSNTQDAGNNSVQFQNINGDLNYHHYENNQPPLTFEHIKGIFDLLMELNFPKLLEEANQQAKENITEMYSMLEEKLKDELANISPEKISSVDSQYVMNQSVEFVARRGKSINLDCLTSLLIEKFKSNDDEYDLLLNEALETINKLTSDEITYISAFLFFYFLRSDSFSSVDQIEKHFSSIKHITPQALKKNPISLSWKRVVIFTPGIANRDSFKNILAVQYPFFKSNISNTPILDELYNIDDKGARSVTLTELGFIIGLINLKRYISIPNIEELFKSFKF